MLSDVYTTYLGKHQIYQVEATQKKNSRRTLVSREGEPLAASCAAPSTELDSMLRGSEWPLGLLTCLS